MPLPLLLDCTLRDGGYYNAWDFDKSIVDEYIRATNDLPVECIEIGYRNNPQRDYLGKYGYCPFFELNNIRKKSKKKISVMLNEKDVRPSNISTLLEPAEGLVDMVRIAIDPQNFDRALVLAEEIKTRGFIVGFNTMYMSKWDKYRNFFDNLSNVNNKVDVFCMVDSYGGVLPEEVKKILTMVKDKVSCSVGFHGHNNLEMGLINTVTAIDSGVDYVDATILGMGRGAGNVKMELLLTYLNKYYGLQVDFNVLGDVITVFSDLLQRYKWGTNLPYMLSGAYSLPQKDVMELVNNRAYSFNNIVRALDNKKDNVVDNAKYPVLNTEKYEKVMIVGGGNSVKHHIDAVKCFIKNNKSIALVHATARNAVFYQDLNIPQYFCLVGSEGRRLSSIFSKEDFNGICILPPYPRKVGTDVPAFVHDVTFELSIIAFTRDYADSCTTVALQVAGLFSNKIFMIGYDGYSGNILSEKEMALSDENRTLFCEFKEYYNLPLISLTPSLYKELDIKSIYQYL
jgi:4-hydroxy 2-oxovalerate aldolase